MDAHATAECTGCDWDRHPQAFRWFPELGAPLRAEDSTAGSPTPPDAGTRSPALPG